MNDYRTEHEKQVENLSARINELEQKQDKILDLLTNLVDFLHEFSKIEENNIQKGVYDANGYIFERDNYGLDMRNSCID